MKKLFASLVLTAALVVTSSALAAGSISTTTTSVASGASFNITACVATAGDGGYLIVKGPNTFSQDLSFGPVDGCLTFPVTTVGWPPGKYRLNGFEFTAKGAKGLGSITLTVTP
ncbi:MAG TPA: hypothetical protein VH108_10270 [Gaiellaceae bacterium]|nr:hypothetical protein [Gaiellaceae bacterium]